MNLPQPTPSSPDFSVFNPFDPAENREDRATPNRPIQPADESAMQRILEKRRGNGGAVGVGRNDHSELPLAPRFRLPRSAYFVMERAGALLGGAGIAPLSEDLPHIAELLGFALLPMIGRRRHGRRLLFRALDIADQFGFQICYVEAPSAQISMVKLLSMTGFLSLDKPLRAAASSGNDSYYFLSLIGP